MDEIAWLTLDWLKAHQPLCFHQHILVTQACFS